MPSQEELTLSFTTKDWKPIPKIGRVIPYGYKQSEEDPDILLPVPLELEALDKAKIYLKTFSYRKVAKWLEEVTGRYISHVGLRKRVFFDKKQKGRINGLKHLTERAEKAKAAAEKILNSRIGAVHNHIGSATIGSAVPDDNKPDLSE